MNLEKLAMWKKKKSDPLLTFKITLIFLKNIIKNLSITYEKDFCCGHQITAAFVYSLR